MGHYRISQLAKCFNENYFSRQNKASLLKRASLNHAYFEVLIYIKTFNSVFYLVYYCSNPFFATFLQ